MTQDGTHVVAWPPSGPQWTTSRGYYLFRIGTNNGTRYFTEDQELIMAIIAKQAPEAMVWEEEQNGQKKLQFGSNYVMVSAPLESWPQLQAAVDAINQQIDHCSEKEARSGKEKALKKRENN